ncbi:MAG TPA: hypothetical protein VIQ30_10845, partial [Pseudonocardia sp.]
RHDRAALLAESLLFARLHLQPLAPQRVPVAVPAVQGARNQRADPERDVDRSVTRTTDWNY